MVLIDTNVLLDLVLDDPVWADWSQTQLEIASAGNRLFINPVIYSELSVGFVRIEELDRFVDDAKLTMLEIPRPALFLAGKAFLNYRKKRGKQTGVLPDFFIGAHAAVAGLPLLTRDRGRYGHYFPSVDLISPE
ncbi:MAG: type II toxin-antitoxin system VapC family toxin [Alphaproteobacteria bacterium]|nr:type II toxin-antitoxin system VapC family toxin [Alphaproteobacteria bacterium]MDX5415121.1 type II toxin-antitoxin system VapC family toxin [Alphaproteobacteria bacterium]MDX5492312.1 type II toxin-antitoxin system VapC family toxin [Alphaproteobacteria bacterium]